MAGSSIDEFQDRVRQRYVCLGAARYRTGPDIPLRFVSLLVYHSHPLFSPREACVASQSAKARVVNRTVSLGASNFESDLFGRAA